MGTPFRDTISVRLSSTVRAAFQGKAPRFSTACTDEEIHNALFRQAQVGNRNEPVGSRFQKWPVKVADLCPSSIFTTSVALQGLVYELSEVPSQQQRPKPFPKTPAGAEAELSEVARLSSVDAIERAPEHDAHKAIDPASAKPYELRPPPSHALPKGTSVPVLPSKQHAEYDSRMMKEMRSRRDKGLPFRDITSNTFSIPKKDGGHRYCTNFKPTLNKFQPKRHFKLEGTKQLQEMISPGDYGVSLDLRDFYLQLGLHPVHRRYCRFYDPRGRRWQWKVLSFGISHAVKLVTKLLRPLIQQLRAAGMKIFAYVDDIVILDASRERAASHMATLLTLLQDHLNLKVKLSKCLFAPSQTFTALGVIWDTKRYVAQLPKQRVLALQRMARRLQSAKSVSVRDLARFVGTAEAARVAMPPAKRRMISIQHQLARAVRATGYTGVLVLNQESLNVLAWWASNEVWKHNQKPIAPRRRPIEVLFGADASFKGWGAWLRLGRIHLQTRGFYTFAEGEEMINLLELQAQELGLLSLLPLAVPKNQWHNVVVRALCDNVTAVKYGNSAVGPSLTMSRQGARMFDIRQRLNLVVHYEHRAGLSDYIQEADYLSRRGWTHVDWVLSWDLYHKALHLFKLRPTTDLFASRSNAKTARYFSWEPEHQALGQDCFKHRWDRRGTLYAFPPPIVLGKLLRKAAQDRVHRLIVVAPTWTSAPWWPSMLQMAVEPPLVLPTAASTTWNPVGAPAFHGKWHLAVWLLSGQPRQQSRYRGSQSSKPWTGSTSRDIQDRMMALSTDGCRFCPPPEIFTQSVLSTFRPVIW